MAPHETVRIPCIPESRPHPIDTALAETALHLPNYVTEPDYIFGSGRRDLGEDSGVYGVYKPHHISGGAHLVLGGHVGAIDGKPTLGLLGRDVSIEDGYRTARQGAVNALLAIKYALDGDWDRLVALSRLMVFVACPSDFTDVHRVSSGASDLFIEVLGDDLGRVARATLGCTSIAANHCLEILLEAEVRP